MVSPSPVLDSLSRRTPWLMVFKITERFRRSSSEGCLSSSPQCRSSTTIVQVIHKVTPSQRPGFEAKHERDPDNWLPPKLSGTLKSTPAWSPYPKRGRFYTSQKFSTMVGLRERRLITAPFKIVGSALSIKDVLTTFHSHTPRPPQAGGINQVRQPVNVQLLDTEANLHIGKLQILLCVFGRIWGLWCVTSVSFLPLFRHLGCHHLSSM